MIDATKKDIDNIVYDILRQSKSFDVFPTPVKDIVQFSELYVDTHTSIYSIPNNYIAKNVDKLKAILKNVYGALDRRSRIIYVEPTLSVSKKNFVQLHEVGHEVLPWQRKTFEFVDYRETISYETKIEFETEANFFAQGALFQLDRFNELARNLPLEIKTAMFLSKKFGSSVHAAIRRYAETINKRCALIVLNKEISSPEKLFLRDYFQSKKFTKEFGSIDLPKIFDISWPFVQDHIMGKKFHDKGLLTIITEHSDIDFEYHYFNSGYNVFILMMPTGERIKTRTKIYLTGYDL